MKMCETLRMPTNLDLDDRLIDEARRLGHHRTKKAAVTEALEEYVLRRRQQQIVAEFGTVDYAADYDYKAERRRR
jgi:Arc/MetJ family transcription regulator